MIRTTSLPITNKLATEMRLSTIVLFATFVCISAVQASAGKRIALVIGQSNYQKGLTKLSNPANDALRMAQILGGNGFEVITCDGRRLGCYDLTQADFEKALKKFKEATANADIALVFYAGHGLETDLGNILAPVDAAVNCNTWSVENGVLLDDFVLATQHAKHKVIIIDACRDNPMAEICPPPNKTLSFTDIKVPNARDFLLVTSTKPGQPAQDGPPGTHSPFATALFAALREHPGVFFDQVFNRVAKAVVEATKKTTFVQLPETVVRGGAPDDCLRGRDCGADPDGARMQKALSDIRRELRQEFSGMRKQSDAALIERAMKGRSFIDIGQAKVLERMIEKGAKFQGVDWNGSSFGGATISGGVFKAARLHGVDLSKVVARGANFEDTGLRFAILERGKFSDSKFSNAYAPYVTAQDAEFENADLSGSVFTGGVFRGARFTAANLRNAVFAFADLRGANFDGADLTGAYLAGARLDGASFKDSIISATDLGGATSDRFGLSVSQRRGACRSAVYRRDGDVDFTLDLYQRRPNAKAKSGHSYHQLYRQRIRADLFGDKSLSLCPKNKDKPKTFNPTFPGALGIYVDADWASSRVAAARVLAMVHSFERRIVASSKGKTLKGEGDQEQIWLQTMRRQSKAPPTTKLAHLGADHLLPLLLKHKAIDPSKVDWKRRAELRLYLEQRADTELRGKLELESQWPRFFPKGVPFSELPRPTIEAFKTWTEHRTRLVPDKTVLRPAMVEFRKLIRESQATTLTIPAFGYLYSAGGSLRATPTSMTAPSWFDTKNIRERWLGLEAHEQSMGLDKVMLVFEHPMKAYRVTIPRAAFTGVDPKAVVPELDLSITNIDASRKSRYGPVAMISVRIDGVRLRTPDRIIWQGKPILPEEPPESITKLDVLGVKLTHSLDQAEAAAAKALGNSVTRRSITGTEALSHGLDLHVGNGNRPDKRLVLFTRSSAPTDRSLIAIAWVQRYAPQKDIIARVVNSLKDKYGEPHATYAYNSGGTWLLWGADRTSRKALRKSGTSADCALYPYRNFYLGGLKSSQDGPEIGTYELKAACGSLLSVFVTNDLLQMLLMDSPRVLEERLALAKAKAEAEARSRSKRAPGTIKF